jgi:DNA-binding beta-propeller fold protein YncE
MPLAEAQRIYVGSHGGFGGDAGIIANVSVIDADPASVTFHTVLTTLNNATGGCPYDIAIDRTGTRAYVGHRSRTFVSVIDLGTSDVTNIALPGTSAAVATPSAIALTPDGARAYVTWLNFLYAIDTATVIDTIADADLVNGALT